MTPKEILKEAFEADVEGLKKALESDNEIYQTICKLVSVLLTQKIISPGIAKEILDVKITLKQFTDKNINKE